MSPSSTGFKFKRFWAASTLAVGVIVANLAPAEAGFSNFEPRGTVRSCGCHTDYALIGGGVAPAVHIAEAPLPQVLKRSAEVSLANKVNDIPSLLRATHVIELNGAVNDRLKHLPSGNYVYAIDSKKRLIIMPRAIDTGLEDLSAPGAQFLGSHESIAQFMKAIYHEGAEFLAAGEITIRDGRAMMVSNGSGTFRGGTENLKYAFDQLKTHGLAINDSTLTYDYSVKQFSNPHTSVANQAKMEIEASRDPGFQSPQRAVQVVMKKVEDRYPGKVDFVRAAIKVEDRDAQAPLLEAAGLMAGWSTPQETEAYVIKNSVTVFGQKLAPRGSSAQTMQSAG